jgi:hypothetical protein
MPMSQNVHVAFIDTEVAIELEQKDVAHLARTAGCTLHIGRRTQRPVADDVNVAVGGIAVLVTVFESRRQTPVHPLARCPALQHGQRPPLRALD